jgi:hypothetical protein
MRLGAKSNVRVNGIIDSQVDRGRRIEDRASCFAFTPLAAVRRTLETMCSVGASLMLSACSGSAARAVSRKPAARVVVGDRHRYRENPHPQYLPQAGSRQPHAGDRPRAGSRIAARLTRTNRPANLPCGRYPPQHRPAFLHTLSYIPALTFAQSACIKENVKILLWRYSCCLFSNTLWRSHEKRTTQPHADEHRQRY